MPCQCNTTAFIWTFTFGSLLAGRFDGPGDVCILVLSMAHAIARTLKTKVETKERNRATVDNRSLSCLLFTCGIVVINRFPVPEFSFCR